MKNKYLEEIRKLFKEYDIKPEELKDILNDYDKMYEDGLSSGLSDEEIVEKLGLPEKVVAELGENYHRREVHSGRGKIIALMPFISLIAFFILGQFGYWHPGWLVFLAIPVSAIILEMTKRHNPHVWTALSPFIVTGVYLLLGFRYQLWHPGWLVFLAIPIIAIVISARKGKSLDTLTALSPFAAVIAFILLGEAGYWNPAWLVFLGIPMIGILHMQNKTRAFFFELTFIAAIGIYLFAGYQYGRWDYGALAFALPVIYGILIGEIHVEWGRKNPWVLATFLLSIAIFFTGGFVWGAWPYLWLVFLAIPVVAILTGSKRKDWFIAISPFIAVTVFFLLGYFGNLWTISWIAFLIIPIAGILKGK